MQHYWVQREKRDGSSEGENGPPEQSSPPRPMQIRVMQKKNQNIEKRITSGPASHPVPGGGRTQRLMECFTLCVTC